VFGSCRKLDSKGQSRVEILLGALGSMGGLLGVQVGRERARGCGRLLVGESKSANCIAHSE
jgi:hypothetical protein